MSELKPRVLAVYLDGYEVSVADRLIEAGRLPALAALRDTSARFQLDHGPAQRTGLAGEHFSTGLSPDDAKRWAAVHFDPQNYDVWQAGNTMPPFVAGRDLQTVVFDPTYFNLNLAGENTQGLVNWGAHDPGVAPSSRPPELVAELTDRFGPYPAKAWLYGHVWASANRTRHMAQALVEAARLRAQAATWLLKQRLPDWDLGIVVSGELHSASEALWFGIDPTHPLNTGTAPAEAAAEAAAGFEQVYEAVDAMVGGIRDAFPDTTLLVFTLGGMGPNRSDIPSMALLPELLYRRVFGEALMTPYPGSTSEAEAEAGPTACPSLDEDQHWARAMLDLLQRTAPDQPSSGDEKRDKKERKRRRRAEQSADSPSSDHLRLPLDWMPASRYHDFWPRMDAFALPSFYDGRVRLNLIGRERDGLVAPAEYETRVAEIEALTRACIDPRTGQSLVDYVEKLPPGQDWMHLSPTACDLVIVWRGTAQALAHPTLGRIGPLPFNRTGGHTGPYGFAYLQNPRGQSGNRPGDVGSFGVRSAFDIVPTILDLLRQPAGAKISGVSLLQESPSDSTSQRA